MRILVAALFLCANTLSSFAQTGGTASSKSSSDLYGPRAPFAQARRKPVTCDSLLRVCLFSCRNLPSPARYQCQGDCYYDDGWCRSVGQDHRHPIVECADCHTR